MTHQKLWVQLFGSLAQRCRDGRVAAIVDTDQLCAGLYPCSLHTGAQCILYKQQLLFLLQNVLFRLLLIHTNSLNRQGKSACRTRNGYHCLSNNGGTYTRGAYSFVIVCILVLLCIEGTTCPSGPQVYLFAVHMRQEDFVTCRTHKQTYCGIVISCLISKLNYLTICHEDDCSAVPEKCLATKSTSRNDACMYARMGCKSQSFVTISIFCLLLPNILWIFSF